MAKYWPAMLRKLSVYHWCLLPVLAVASYLIFDRQFIQDDAFISFRYAQHFAQGHGLVWYPGSHEYGYTNFLFTLLIGLLMKAGVGVPYAAYLISVPASLITLVLVYAATAKISRLPAVGLMVAALLATNHSYAAYATSGLETSLVLCLIVICLYFALCIMESAHTRHIWGLGLCAALSLLTRLDSVILLVPLYALLSLSGSSLASGLKNAMHAAIAPSIALLGLMIFSLTQYGQFFPNSFYAKAADWEFAQGIYYLRGFLEAQYYLLLAPLIIWFYYVQKEDFNWRKWRLRLCLLAMCVLWVLYILRAGGDFMEFRFILPLFVLYLILAFALLSQVNARKTMQMLYFACALCLLGNALQPYYFPRHHKDENYIESTAQLNRWVDRPYYSWSLLGKKLGELFYTGSENDVHIAVAPAGAIPFYSKLPVTDIHGLNTRAVFKNSTPFLKRPGHRHKATLELHQKRGVNLIIDHPIFIRKKKEGYICIRRHFLFTHKYLWQVPTYLLPVNEKYMVFVHYLTPHPLIDELIQKNTLIPYAAIEPELNCSQEIARAKKAYEEGTKRRKRMIRKPKAQKSKTVLTH